MTELSAENLDLVPIPGEEGLVALVIAFKDPETGVEWKASYPRVRIEDLGADADGQHRYALTPIRLCGEQWEFRGASG